MQKFFSIFLVLTGGALLLSLSGCLNPTTEATPSCFPCSTKKFVYPDTQAAEEKIRKHEYVAVRDLSFVTHGKGPFLYMKINGMSTHRDGPVLCRSVFGANWNTTHYETRHPKLQKKAMKLAILQFKGDAYLYRKQQNIVTTHENNHYFFLTRYTECVRLHGEVIRFTEKPTPPGTALPGAYSP